MARRLSLWRYIMKSQDSKTLTWLHHLPQHMNSALLAIGHIILLNMRIRTQICIIINAFCTFGTGFLSISKSFLHTLGCDTPSMQRSTYKRFTKITLPQLCQQNTCTQSPPSDTHSTYVSEGKKSKMAVRGVMFRSTYVIPMKQFSLDFAVNK